MPIRAAETNPLEITTIDNYFSQIYSGKDLEDFYNSLNDKLSSYTIQYPSAICISSPYLDYIFLGTLNFQELDRDGYPTYTGNVVKSSQVIDMEPITYSTLLSHIIDRTSPIWRIRLISTEPVAIGQPSEEITFKSSPTTSLNPTSVDYIGISRPTSGACFTLV